MSSLCLCRPRCPSGASCKDDSPMQLPRRFKSQVQQQQGDVSDGAQPSSSHANSKLPVAVKRKYCALDFDTLDCPVCLEPLFPPVFQCLNGHPACENCCKQLRHGPCPSCAQPIGTNRCIAVEKIIESLQVSCKFTAWGCTEMLQYAAVLRENHERSCKFRPLRCPVANCDYKGLKAGLRGHFDSAHSARRMREVVYSKGEPLKIPFRVRTKDSAYDHSHSQYVIVNAQVDDDDDEDEEDDEVDDLEDRNMFLIHHQFHEKFSRYSFSCTSFGASSLFTHFRLSVMLENTRGFKARHSIDGALLDNQRDDAILTRLVQKGDCLFVPKLMQGAQKVASSFNVVITLLAEEAEDEEGVTLDDYDDDSE